MDFNQQSLGSLLFLLESQYLKKEIRNIEKMNKRLIHIKSGINFNHIYIYIYLPSHYIYIYIYIKQVMPVYGTGICKKKYTLNKYHSSIFH